MDDPTLDRNDDASQYEVWVGGKVASVAIYDVDGDRVTITHTETRPEFRGRGLAELVVRYALGDIRSQGRRAEATCPFAAAVIERSAA